MGLNPREFIEFAAEGLVQGETQDLDRDWKIRANSNGGGTKQQWP